MKRSFFPPGFDLLNEDFDKGVENNTIEKYSLTGRQVIVYLREIAGNQRIALRYRMKARFPIKAKSQASRVYDYYNPSMRGETPSREIRVKNPK